MSQKTEFINCFTIHCSMGNIQKLLCEMQVDFICASKNTRTNAPSQNSLAKGVLRMRIVRGKICRYYWIVDYTIIMLDTKSREFSK